MDNVSVEFKKEAALEVQVEDINYIPSYKIAEAERQANEKERIENEEEREAFYEDILTQASEGKINNVYVGTEEPTGSMVNVWINPQGESSDQLATKEDVYNEAQARETTDENLQSQIDKLASKNDVNTALYDEANTRAATDVGLQNQINSLASGSPLVASSISGMTDTTRVYVNTTDGHWYYYNGTGWVDGGVYQSTEIAENSIGFNEVDFLELGDNKLILEKLPLIEDGLNFDITDDYWVHIHGTKVGKILRSTIAEFKVDETGVYTLSKHYNSVYNPTAYIYNGSTQIGVLTASSSFVNLNLEKNVKYTLEIYLPAGTYDILTYFKLEHGSTKTGFEPPYIKLKNGCYEDFKSFNKCVLSTTITTEKVANIDTVNNKISFSSNVVVSYVNKAGLNRINLNAPIKSQTYNLLEYDQDNKALPGIYYLTLNNQFEFKSINYTNFDFSKGYLLIGTFYYIPSQFKYIDISFDFSYSINSINKLKGKKLSICGVSIDTYQGWISSGNTTYYTPSNLASVENMWWKKLINKTELDILVNNSNSGSCVTTVKGVEGSGVHRCLTLDKNNVNPDYIIIGAFGLNDWIYSELGSYTDDMVLPSKDIDLTDGTNYSTYQNIVENYSSALATMFARIYEKYPDAKLFVMDSYNYYRSGNVPFTKEGNKSINSKNKALYEIAEKFGVEVIKISECGITAYNSKNYCVEASNVNVGIHPNNEGHTMIYNKVLEHFVKYM